MSIKEKPYTISKSIWDTYYRAQMSGHMNMMGHPLVVYFLEGDAWQRAHDHFETAGNIESLVIT